MIAFFFDGPSSNHAEVYSFNMQNCFERKRGWGRLILNHSCTDVILASGRAENKKGPFQTFFRQKMFLFYLLNVDKHSKHCESPSTPPKYLKHHHPVSSVSMFTFLTFC